MLWTLACATLVQVKVPGAAPVTWFRLGPTSPGTVLTLLTRGAQSVASGTRSLSSSGSTQSALPSWSLSRNPSSVERLQLSSIPLHNSGAPGWMAATASLQSPPHVVNPSRSTSKSSSTAPLQLSSMLLQTSAVGEPGVQVWGTPATQLLTVRWQAPTPHVVVPRLLSTVPSQLSSMLLQTSTVRGRSVGV